ncbi:sensor histidine kinase [Alistipes indistinctus]|uniref:sensor histidine kinase n=1 Tax=Alistipes indistinctus TaxID=626932 RepID=UPI0026DC73A8|nr:ATP-binding protein [Alistipes indistinctus]
MSVFHIVASRPIRKITAAAAALFFLLLALIPGTLRAQIDSREGIILVVASYNPDTRRMSGFISDFEQAIVQKKVPYEIVVEDMGCKGLSEAPQWQERMRDILDRYRKNKQLKAVVLLGQEAWASFLAQGDFPDDIPFFGCYASVNGIALSSLNVPQRDWSYSVDMAALADSIGTAGGCLNRYDVDKNVDLIRSLYPDVRNIAFVSDNTYGGVSLQALMRREMLRYDDLRLIQIDSREGSDSVVSRITRLPQHSALLIGTWRVGDDGQYLMYSAMNDLIAENPTVPVFTLSGAGLESVAIGGYNPKYKSGAGEIAGQIAGYYHGKPGAVHFELSDGEYRFNANKLKEFDIAEYKLPAGSVVVDNTEAQLRKYRSVIYSSVAALILLSLIAVFIYFLYYKNKRLRNVLENREAELIEAKEKAEESDLLKSAFLANMSHEIRTPLNAIVGFSSLLTSAEISPEEREEYSAIISTNSELMLTLINDILDISRLETGKIHFVYEDIDIPSLCQQVIMTTTHNRREGVECVFESSYETYTLRTDVQRLSQVLINLLTNANKFTEQGRITLSFEVLEKEGMVRFAVADTGCGIPPEKQAKVFDRFEKLDEFKQGTGLGLAICRQIVMKVGGKIWVDGTYTSGSRFVFTHPIRPLEDGDAVVSVGSGMA